MTQLLQLLDLHPDILEYIRSLAPGTPPRLVTERKLRTLLKCHGKVQVRAARARLPGFAQFMDTRARAAP